MFTDRPIVLSLAGLDPSAGAGLLADIKTFEQNFVYGLGIATAQTLQTENQFLKIKWEKNDDVVFAAEKMLLHYDVKAVKIGITENISVLKKIVETIYAINPLIKIIVDPVIRSGTGFQFWNEKINNEALAQILSKIYLLTPNYQEIMQLTIADDPMHAAQKLSQFCSILLKGGHNNEEKGVDYLFRSGEVIRIETEENAVFPKHGSGCVLSSAIAANLAKGLTTEVACKEGKKYVEQFLKSNESLLGYHAQQSAIHITGANETGAAE